MEKLKEVLDKALELVTPSKEEEIEVKNIADFILKKIGKSKYFRVILGGSGAKGTWLKGAYDVDLFVLFNYRRFHNKSDNLSGILEKHLKKKFGRIIRLHGSRDYFQVRHRNFTFEIVPILDIKKAKDAKNITDVSPLHSAWVGKHKKLANEMRLLKQFCKANSCYGAESYIQGFSGYICEILTVYYGSFLNAVKKASMWKDKVVIDAERFYKGKDPLFELNKAKTVSPLVIIDPVQKDRNASAAVSKEKFERFKNACVEFLKKPDLKFFVKKDLTVEELKKRAGKNKLLVLSVEPLAGKVDVVGCQLLKVFEHIRKQLIFYEFNVFDSGWEWDKKNKALFYFILDPNNLEKRKMWEGPPLKAKIYVEEFKKKYKKVFTDGKRIFAWIERRFTNGGELVKAMEKDPYVKERCKGYTLGVYG